MDDGVAFAYVGQELVAQSLALTGTLYQSGNVHDIAHGRYDAARVNQLGQTGEPFVGYGHLAQLGIDGTEGEVGCLRLSAGQTIEECGLAYVGQSHDTCFESHIFICLYAI